MPHNRFYTPSELLAGAEVVLNDTESDHLVKVVRVRVGEQVELVNGRGVLALARREANALRVESVQHEAPPLERILALALTRPALLEWAVEKGCELGATAFWLFPGQLSDKQELSAAQKGRLAHIAIAALKQCGRLYLPPLIDKPALRSWGALAETVLCADPAPHLPYFWELTLERQAAWVWCIGPERGFHEEERAHLEQVLKAQSCRLHPHTLRAETAPLVALALSAPFTF
jgi:16S rRNA (uracil1498-N3)-methyltransferase